MELWLTVCVLVACVTLLLLTRVAPDLILIGGLAILLIGGVITSAEGLSGFSNEGILTIALLYVVAAGLRETGALDLAVLRLFRRPRSVLGAQLRMMLPVTIASAFVNNTPVVASFIPAVSDWAKKLRVAPSKLMIPLSYAAIFGGTCTLVGTSTNLVVHGLLLADPGARGFTFFELAWVGIPAALVGTVYVLVVGRFGLPTRLPPLERLKDAREYTVEMLVEPRSPLIGQSVEQAGLRQLPGLYLVEIDRDGHVLPAVPPEEILQAGDRLVFAGVTDSVIDLQRIRGLKPATDQLFKLDVPRPQREFIEAVVAASSPMQGKTIREGRFRSQYGAVVIAVAREGRRIEGKIGDIELHAGDTLLLETDSSFMEQFRDARDFLLLRPIHGASPPSHERAALAWAIMAGIVVAATSGLLPLLQAAAIGAGLMLVTRCISPSMARSSVDLSVILVIAAAFGIGRAVEVSGGGAFLAEGILSLAGQDPLAVLIAVYVVTALLTEIITNNAAAALMFPLAAATARQLGLDIMPFAVAVVMAASASFATPIGYQTNLMVYGPGGYRFSDYLRFGLPLNVLLGAVSLAIIPHVWPF